MKKKFTCALCNKTQYNKTLTFITISEQYEVGICWSCYIITGKLFLLKEIANDKSKTKKRKKKALK